MEDRRIIELFRERSEQAIAELAAKYGARCARLAENILGSAQDAEECLNDAYLGAWNSIPPQEPEPLVTYLCRIVRNLAIRRYHTNTARKRASSYDAALDELADCLAAPGSVEDALTAAELGALLERFLDTLDTDSRALFVRRYWYADDTAALAERFGISGNNVSVRLSRIRQRLRDYLRKEGYFS